MAKKNLPNIPIYIGDWERDCNVLTLEAESAWMRIIFKMWTSGKQSIYKLPTKGLQNLWRCSPEKMEEILLEFTDYNICDVNIDGRFVEFVCRRFKKENEISEVRSEAVSSRYAKKPKNKIYKPSTKHIQSTDIDNENESDNVIKINKKVKIPEIEEFINYAIENKPNVNKETLTLKYKSWIENGWKTGGEKPRVIKNWKTTLLNTLPHIKENDKNNKNEPTINRQTADTIKQNLSGWGD